MNYSKTHNNKMKQTFKKIVKELDTLGYNPQIKNDSIHYEGEFDHFNLTATTSIGEMNLSLYDDWLHLKFAEVKKAVNVFGPNVNPFNAKHNFHPGIKGNKLPCILDWFKLQLRILSLHE